MQMYFCNLNFHYIYVVHSLKLKYQIFIIWKDDFISINRVFKELVVPVLAIIRRFSMQNFVLKILVAINTDEIFEQLLLESCVTVDDLPYVFTILIIFCDLIRNFKICR